MNILYSFLYRRTHQRNKESLPSSRSSFQNSFACTVVSLLIRGAIVSTAITTTRQTIIFYPAIRIISTIHLPHFVSASSTPGNTSSNHRHVRSPSEINRNMMEDDDNDDDVANIVVGGGSVNEKERLFNKSKGAPSSKSISPHHQKNENSIVGTDDPSSSLPSSHQAFNPVQYRSHLLHAIEGLHRYPNYLLRWKEEDIESLEMALEERLQKVRTQKSKLMQQRRDMQHLLRAFLQKHPQWETFVQVPESWDEIQSTILDPRASAAIFRSKFFRQQQLASVQDVLSGMVQVELDTSYLQEWMDEEFHDVYSFPLLSDSFCNNLHTFVSAMMDFMTDDDESSQTVAVLNRGIHKDLDNMGMSWLNDLVFHLIVRPVSSQLYKETDLAGGDLDWRQGFIASYSANPTHSKPRQRLVPHTDDAEVTLNICLGDKFDGGNLLFWGLREDDVRKSNKLLGEYEPEIGRAVLHSGRHLHEVTPITSGNRFAYIQWTRSWASSRKETCPCCWLNRRGLTNGSQECCVCGPRWN